MNDVLEDLSLLETSKTYGILYNKDGSKKPFYILTLLDTIYLEKHKKRA